MFKKIKEKSGYRFTTARRKILEAILDSNIHLNVKEININGISYHEMKIFSRKSLHMHFKCFNCNSIIDIDSQILNFDYLRLNKKVEAENDLEIYDLNIMFIRCQELCL